jgi:hypothetical protein
LQLEILFSHKHHEKLISEWLEKLLRSIDFEMAKMCKDEAQIKLNFSLRLIASCLSEVRSGK